MLRFRRLRTSVALFACKDEPAASPQIVTIRRFQQLPATMVSALAMLDSADARACGSDRAWENTGFSPTEGEVPGIIEPASTDCCRHSWRAHPGGVINSRFAAGVPIVSRNLQSGRSREDSRREWRRQVCQREQRRSGVRFSGFRHGTIFPPLSDLRSPRL